MRRSRRSQRRGCLPGFGLHESLGLARCLRGTWDTRSRTETGAAPPQKEDNVALSLTDIKGCPLDRQRFTWRELVQKPISKLDDDAFTRVRIILLNGLEMEALRFSHSAARMNRALREPLARLRRVEQHQATMVNWLIGADHSPLETTIAYEQVAIEVTAAVAQTEPDA